MPRSAKDIQLIELKDSISKLNELILAQTRSIDSLNKTIEELHQELGNKQAEVDYLKSKLFGSQAKSWKRLFSVRWISLKQSCRTAGFQRL